MHLDRQRKQEQMPPENGVYQKEGKWFMRFDSKSDGVELPEKVARVIRVALLAERRAARSGSWASSVKKEGLYLPFQIIPSEEIYQHQTPDAKWAVGPVEAIIKSQEAKRVRSLLNRYRPSNANNDGDHDRPFHRPTQ